MLTEQTLYTLRRVIERYGHDCTFYREQKNEFKESEGLRITCNKKGLFHESGAYLGITLKEAGKVSSDRQPKLLMLHEDVQQGDIVMLNNVTYNITGVENIGNLNALIDLSLEEAVTCLNLEK